MRHSLALLITLSILGCNDNKGQKTINKHVDNVTDSIKTELDFNDSIRLLKKDYYDSTHLYVFIDYNKHSKFHSELISRFFDNVDTSMYNQVLKERYNSIAYKPSIPQKLITKWIPLYKYKGEYYVTLDCYFQLAFEITDSTFVQYFMDGPSPYFIIGTEIKDKLIKLETTKNDFIDFNLVNSDKQIYLVKLGNSCNYYIPINKLNDFNIIVQHCHDMQVDLIKFDEIKCK